MPRTGLCDPKDCIGQCLAPDAFGIRLRIYAVWGRIFRYERIYDFIATGSHHGWRNLCR